jgi:hypothetical protein
MKRTIRVNFSDFDPGYKKDDNYFYHLLRTEFDVVIDEVNPEYHIYSCFGTEFLNYNGVRIFYTGENDAPDFNLCDYALSCHPIQFGERYKRFPNFVTYNQHQPVLNRTREVKREELTEKKFCNFIVSSTWAHPARDEFYQLLSRYKKIDSPGKVFNNMQMASSGRGWYNDKLEFMRKYKFSVTFENSSVPGYTTEKILHAFVSNTIPVYWGNPEVMKDFNPKAFINCHDYKSQEEVMAKIIELDTNDELYLNMINEPLFAGNKIPEYYEREYILSFFRNIFSQPYDKAFRRSQFGFNGTYEKEYIQLISDANDFKKAYSGFKGVWWLFKKVWKARF